VDKKWLIRRGIVLVISLGGIAIAATIPIDPHKIVSKTTNMISPPPINPFSAAIAGSAITEAYGEDIRIGAAIPGLIEETWVKVWDKVEKDQPLFIIDTRAIRAKIEVDKQEISVRKRRVELLEIQYQRFLSVTDPRAISEESISTKLSELNVARSELERAVAQLEADEVELDRHIVRAPQAGRVLRTTIHKGEFFGDKPGGGGPLPTGTAVINVPFEIILGNTDYIQIRMDVDEQSASRVHPNRKAIGYPRGVLKRPFELEFVRIEPFIIPKKSLTGESDERIDTRVLQIIYRLRPPDDFPIYFGQQFDVFIEADPVPEYHPNGNHSDEAPS